MARSFGAEERYVCSLFADGARFSYKGVVYTVVTAGKPTCGSGEPKTDIYVAARSDRGELREFKISLKKENADFLENKTNAERAKNILGANWSEIIARATTDLRQEFTTRPLIYKDDYRHTEAGSITLGWKFELLNKEAGQLSGDMQLSTEQVIDVYAGTNIAIDKRNAYVNGRIITNSGVANFILFEESRITSIQDAIDALVPIEEYVRRHPKVYFACKALNYRSFADKYDGNRPLAVYVDWDCENGKLTANLRFDEPLKRGGDYAADRLKRALRILAIRNTNDLNSTNIANRNWVYGSLGMPSTTPHQTQRFEMPRTTPVHRESNNVGIKTQTRADTTNRRAIQSDIPTRQTIPTQPRPVTAASIPQSVPARPSMLRSEIASPSNASKVVGIKANVGDTVTHKHFGDGEITSISDGRMLVEFRERVVPFQYPQAFTNGFLFLKK